jgi:hypothetical protein
MNINKIYSYFEIDNINLLSKIKPTYRRDEKLNCELLLLITKFIILTIKIKMIIKRKKENY